MAGIRSKRVARDGLIDSIREVEGAPEHLPSAGDDLIKRLAARQVSTQTTLAEQLSVRQNFISSHILEPLQQSGLTQVPSDVISKLPDETRPVTESDCTIQDLCNKSGLSRQELESQLSIKPNSEISRLYKFALSNDSGNRPHCLLDQLPGHPINNLKLIEEELFLKTEKGTVSLLGSGDKPQGKRKRRVRRKKKWVELGCEPKPEESENSSFLGSATDFIEVSKKDNRQKKSLVSNSREAGEQIESTSLSEDTNNTPSFIRQLSRRSSEPYTETEPTDSSPRESSITAEVPPLLDAKLASRQEDGEEISSVGGNHADTITIDDSALTDSVRKRKTSLWDVKEIERSCGERRQKKMFTIKDGVIVPVDPTRHDAESV